MNAPIGEAASTSPLRTPLVSVFAAVACLAAFATAFGYLGGFLNPDGNARDMSLALVNEDRGAVLGQPVAFGRQVVAQIRAPNPALGHEVKWTVLLGREAALDGLAHDRYFACAGHTGRLLATSLWHRVIDHVSPARSPPRGAYQPCVGQLCRYVSPDCGDDCGRRRVSTHHQRATR
jgi:hypothetical protein